MMKKQTGFTLIEFIMVMVLLSIIGVVSSKMLATGLSAYMSGENIINGNAQAQLGLERMMRDLRIVRSPSDISSATASQFSYVDIDGNSNTYTLSGTTLTRNSQILADGISGLTFTYFDKNGASTSTVANIRYITITLNISEKNVIYSIDSTVYPRNLP